MEKLKLSLQELENDYWEDIDYPTDLVKRCHELRKIPLAEYNVDDLRFMIGQNQGLQYLIPPAFNLLENSILIEGDYYEGDLLASVLMASPDFWRNNPALWESVYLLVQNESEFIKDDTELSQEIKLELLSLIDSFSRLIDNY